MIFIPGIISSYSSELASIGYFAMQAADARSALMEQYDALNADLGELQQKARTS